MQSAWKQYICSKTINELIFFFEKIPNALPGSYHIIYLYFVDLKIADVILNRTFALLLFIYSHDLRCESVQNRLIEKCPIIQLGLLLWEIHNGPVCRYLHFCCLFKFMQYACLNSKCYFNLLFFLDCKLYHCDALSMNHIYSYWLIHPLLRHDFSPNIA